MTLAIRPAPAIAAPVGACEDIRMLDWRSLSTKSFIILYPQEYEIMAQILAARGFGRDLDAEFSRFSAFYQTAPPAAITIRIYPDIGAFSCLNTPSTEIDTGSMHSNSGGREIALIGNNIQENFSAWIAQDINLIRYELSLIFARQVAGDQLPFGLGQAIGRYSQDPSRTFGLLDFSSISDPEPAHSWRSLWEESGSDLLRQVEATSTVAFLVDSYGWGEFLSFLKHLSTSRSYRISLEQIYRIAPEEIEQNWRAFYPLYLNNRWKVHPIYNYDLSGFHSQILAEQYAEADRSLQSALDFLHKMDDRKTIIEAQRLQVRAKKGQEADYMFAQSRQAYENGRYAESLAWLGHAEKLYAEAGTRIFHLDEFSAYRQQVRETLGLHLELDRLEVEAGENWNTFFQAQKLSRLAERQYLLGDVYGHQRSAKIADLILARRQAQYLAFASIVIGITLVLLFIRIRMARRKPPAEAQL